MVKEMPRQTPPEILRTNIASFILTLKALGVDNILAFDLMDTPSIDAMAHALETLYALGAMDDATRLTEAGWKMSAFPTDVRLAKMLLESVAVKCAWEVLTVAAALQVRDLFQPPNRTTSRPQKVIDYEAALAEYADASGDHVSYVNLLTAYDDQPLNAEECRERFLNHLAIKRAMEVRRQLARFLRQFGSIQSMGLSTVTVCSRDAKLDEPSAASGELELDRSQAIRWCVAAGFFGNTAKLASDGRYYTLRSRVLVTPGSSSILSLSSAMSSEYIVFGETYDGLRGRIELRAVSSIEARWLRLLAPHYWR
jgi:HrpA-like RNA helicase